MATLWRAVAVLLVVLLIGCGLLLAMVYQPIIYHGSAPTREPVDPEQLEQLVRQLTAFTPRSHQHPENLERTAAFIAKQLQATGARVSEQIYTVSEQNYRNVIATFGPTSGPHIVIGAHYDTYKDSPGADDNASGVAGLITLAQHLAGQPLQSTVELVAYTLEEMPHSHTPAMGSVVHAQSLKAAGIEVMMMISLEMIGFFSDSPNSQHFPISALAYLYPTTANWIGLVSNWQTGVRIRAFKAAMQATMTLPVHSMNAPVSFVPDITRSDHNSYWQADYPAMMITDTSNFRNRYYHTLEDTPEKLDYSRMAEVVTGIIAAVKQVANQ